MKGTGITQILDTSNKVLQLLSVFHQKLMWCFFFQRATILQLRQIRPWEKKEKKKKIILL